MSLRKMWGLIVVLCAAPAVLAGVLVWAVLPDRPVYGIVTVAVGLAVSALGGLLMWFGRHPVPRPVSSTPPDDRTLRARDLQDAPGVLAAVVELFT